MAVEAHEFLAPPTAPSDSELDTVTKSLLENTNPDAEGKPDPQDSHQEPAEEPEVLDPEPEGEEEDQTSDDTDDELDDDPQESGDNEEEVGEDLGDEDEDDEGDDGSDDDLAAELIDVKVDGKVTQVTLDELTRDYSGRQAIDARLQEASEAKNAAMAETQALQQERGQAKQALQFAQALIAAEADPEIDWEELHELDPTEWAYQRQKAADKQAKYQGIANAMQQQANNENAAMQTNMDAVIANQRAELRKAYPVFNDQEKGEARRVKLEAFALDRYGKYGLTQEDISGVHMAVPLIMLGELYDIVKGDGQPKPKKKRRRIKRSVRPGTGTKITPAVQSKKRRDRLQKRAQESGHPDDIAALMLQPK